MASPLVNLEGRVSLLEREIAVLRSAFLANASRNLSTADQPGLSEEEPAQFVSDGSLPPPKLSDEERRATLEARVKELERMVAGFQAVLGVKPEMNAWIYKIFGQFADDPDYEKAVKAGAAWRRRQR